MGLKDWLKTKGFLKGDFDWKTFLKKQVPYLVLIIGFGISYFAGLPEGTAWYGISATTIVAIFKDIENILKHL